MCTSLIGSFLKKQRQMREITVTELARNVGVSQPFLSNVEKGEKNITVERFFSIVKEIAKLSKINILESKSSSTDEYRKILEEFSNKVYPEFSEFQNKIQSKSTKVTESEYKEFKHNFMESTKGYKIAVISEIVNTLLLLFDLGTGEFEDYDEKISETLVATNDINKKLSLRKVQTLDLNFITDDKLLKYFDLRIDGKKLTITDKAILEAAILGIRARKN